jgi:hypothetical protein
MNQSNQNPNSQKYLMSLDSKVDKLGNFSLNLLRTLPLWRLVGYALLFLFVIDMLEILIPPNFLNPEWEFNALGEIIERIPVPLLAFLLIFYGGQYLRQKWEQLFLSFASWLTLIIGIFFLFALPLGIINTFRIDIQTQQSITDRTNQRLEVLQAVENNLAEVKNTEEMQVLMTQLNRANTPIFDEQEQLEQAKSNLQDLINNNREELKTQAKITKTQTRNSLIKRSVKWNLGTLISGILFIMFWKMTKWARDYDSSSSF